MQRDFPFIFFLLLVLLVTAAFVGLVSEFLMSIFWAVVLTILFHNTYDKIRDRLNGRENWAAILTLLFILLIVIVPIFLVGSSLLNETLFFYEKVNSGEMDLRGMVGQVRQGIPIDETTLERYGLDMEKIREAIEEAATNASREIARQAFTFTQNIFGFFLQFFLMLYLLFFFFRDGKQIIEGIVWVLPIGDDKERALLERFDSVARATVRGSLLVAIIQGTIGGILFWAVGIPAPMLWGVLMTFLSLLPIGSAVIWAPAAIMFFFQGEVGRAIAIVLVGSLVIGLADNFLRPRLVGQDTKMPDYLILIATLGGITWFGLSGFVIGPIIAALFITCWQMLGNEYGQ